MGRTGPGVVATRDLAAGAVLDTGNTRVDHQPEPLVPDGAVRGAPERSSAGRTRVRGRGGATGAARPRPASEVAARLPAGTRAMAIPVEPGQAPPLVIGDRVDVLVALPPEMAGDGPPGFALATEVLVVDVSDAAVTIAVPTDTAPRVAVAFGAGAVTLALTGAG